MDPALQEILSRTEGESKVEAIVKIKSNKDFPKSIRLVSLFGEIATCRLDRANIQDVWADKNVFSLKASRYFGQAHVLKRLASQGKSFGQAQGRRPLVSETGKGVVIGILDWGFDFTHPNFIDDKGETRFLAIWDQTEKAHSSDTKYGYGQVYHKSDINNALLKGQPFESIGYHPAKGDPEQEGAHGTHVLDIAAGNGAIGIEGIAPQAEIIAVHLSAKGVKGLASLGDSVRILEAIDFIAELAGDRPLVINMSVGKHGGSHQGNSLVEQGMDFFLQEKPGRAIVQSCGNYYLSKTHSSGRIAPGASKSLTWIVDENDKTLNELEIWYSSRDVFSVELIVPDGLAKIEVPLGEKKSIVINGEKVGRLYHRANEPNTGDHHIDIFLYKAAPSGDWKVKLTGKAIVDGRFHAWIERDGACKNCQSRFSKTDADPLYSTNTICNGLHTIAVGAYETRTLDRQAAPFSSSGPTVDGRQKPNILAPGVRIEAARSSTSKESFAQGELTRKTGASMAAPHVAGAIALLFEGAARPLSIDETRNFLISSADKPTPKTEKLRFKYGDGYLNIKRLLENAHVTHLIKSNTDHYLSPSNQSYPMPQTTDNENFHTIFTEAAETNSVITWIENQDEFLTINHINFPNPIRDYLFESGYVDSISSKGKFVLSNLNLFEGFRKSLKYTEHLSPFIEVIGLPGQSLREELKPGDVLMRRIPGVEKFVFHSFLKDGLLEQEKNLSEGIKEKGSRGYYSRVIEKWPKRRGLREDFYRQILDENGRLLADQIILRIVAPLEFSPITEKVPTESASHVSLLREIIIPQIACPEKDKENSNEVEKRFGNIPDETIRISQIDYDDAKESNIYWYNCYFWKNSFNSNIHPKFQPVAYANRTYKLQKLLFNAPSTLKREVKSNLPKSVRDRPSIWLDGVLGPMTLLWVLSYLKFSPKSLEAANQQVALKANILGLGFNLEKLEFPGNHTKGRATAAVSPAEFVTRFPIEIEGEKFIKFFLSQNKISRFDDQSLKNAQAYFFKGFPEDQLVSLSAADLAKGFSLLLNNLKITGTAAFFRIKRPFVIPGIDFAELIQEFQTKEFSRFKFLNHADRKHDENSLINVVEALGIVIPKGQKFNTLIAEISAQDIDAKALEKINTNFIVILTPPDLSLDKRQNVLSIVLQERLIRKRELAKPKGDQLIQILQDPRRTSEKISEKLNWRTELSSFLLREISIFNDPENGIEFENVLDYLVEKKCRFEDNTEVSCKDFLITALFFEKGGVNAPAEAFMESVVETKYKDDPLVQKLKGELEADVINENLREQFGEVIVNTKEIILPKLRFDDEEKNPGPFKIKIPGPVEGIATFIPTIEKDIKRPSPEKAKTIKKAIEAIVEDPSDKNPYKQILCENKEDIDQPSPEEFAAYIMIQAFLNKIEDLPGVENLSEEERLEKVGEWFFDDIKRMTTFIIEKVEKVEHRGITRHKITYHKISRNIEINNKAPQTNEDHDIQRSPSIEEFENEFLGRLDLLQRMKVAGSMERPALFIVGVSFLFIGGALAVEAGVTAGGVRTVLGNLFKRPASKGVAGVLKSLVNNAIISNLLYLVQVALTDEKLTIKGFLTATLSGFLGGGVSLGLKGAKFGINLGLSKLLLWESTKQITKKVMLGYITKFSGSLASKLIFEGVVENVISEVGTLFVQDLVAMKVCDKKQFSDKKAYEAAGWGGALSGILFTGVFEGSGRLVGRLGHRGALYTGFDNIDNLRNSNTKGELISDQSLSDELVDIMEKNGPAQTLTGMVARFQDFNSNLGRFMGKESSDEIAKVLFDEFDNNVWAKFLADERVPIDNEVLKEITTVIDNIRSTDIGLKGLKGLERYIGLKIKSPNAIGKPSYLGDKAASTAFLKFVGDIEPSSLDSNNEILIKMLEEPKLAKLYSEYSSAEKFQISSAAHFGRDTEEMSAFYSEFFENGGTYNLTTFEKTLIIQAMEDDLNIFPGTFRVLIKNDLLTETHLKGVLRLGTLGEAKKVEELFIKFSDNKERLTSLLDQNLDDKSVQDILKSQEIDSVKVPSLPPPPPSQIKAKLTDKDKFFEGKLKDLDDNITELPEDKIFYLKNTNHISEAGKVFKEQLSKDKEMALLRKNDSNEYIIIQGYRSSVGTPKTFLARESIPKWSEILESRFGSWMLDRHVHPIDPKTNLTDPTNWYPSGEPGDFQRLRSESESNGGIARNSTITIITENGPVEIEFGYNPKRTKKYHIKGVPGETEPLRFSSIEEYRDFYKDKFKVEVDQSNRNQSSVDASRRPRVDVELEIKRIKGVLFIIENDKILHFRNRELEIEYQEYIKRKKEEHIDKEKPVFPNRERWYLSVGSKTKKAKDIIKKLEEELHITSSKKEKWRRKVREEKFKDFQVRFELNEGNIRKLEQLIGESYPLDSIEPLLKSLRQRELEGVITYQRSSRGKKKKGKKEEILKLKKRRAIFLVQTKLTSLAEELSIDDIAEIRINGERLKREISIEEISDQNSAKFYVESSEFFDSLDKVSSLPETALDAFANNVVGAGGIVSSRTKLQQLIDRGILSLERVNENYKFEIEIITLSGKEIKDTIYWPVDDIGAAWELHHLQELKFGGADEINNLIPLSKGDHSIVSEWWDKAAKVIQEQWTRQHGRAYDEEIYLDLDVYHLTF